MKKTLTPVVALFALVVLLLLGVSYLGSPFAPSTLSSSTPSASTLPPSSASPTPVKDQSIGLEPIKLSPQLVTFRFLDRFFQSRPPTLSTSSGQEAWELLSQTAQKGQEAKPGTAGSRLQDFVAMTDLPSEGWEVGSYTENGAQATVSTLWHYSSGSVEKVFILVSEAGEWKVDKIN